MGEDGNPYGKYVSAGMAAFGVIALAAAGFVNISTPGEDECKEALTDQKVLTAQSEGDVKACLAEKELLIEAKDACKDALKTLTEDPR